MSTLTRSADRCLIDVQLGNLGEGIQLLYRLRVDVPSSQYHFSRFASRQLRICIRALYSMSRIRERLNLSASNVWSKRVHETLFTFGRRICQRAQRIACLSFRSQLNKQIQRYLAYSLRHVDTFLTVIGSVLFTCTTVLVRQDEVRQVYVFSL